MAVCTIYFCDKGVIIMIEPMNPLYETLKLEIKRYEIQEQLAFDEVLQELRRDRVINIYNTTSSDNKYTGNVFLSKNCGEFMVTEYFNYDKIAVIFLNSGYRMLARANNINKGELKDPYAKSILGIGCIGVGPYRVDGNPFERMVYSRWRGILDRCYVKRERHKSVHPEWWNFQYFAAWFTASFYSVPYNSMYDMVVDKDVLCPGNEEYGPYKCLILPNFINAKVQVKDFEKDRIEALMSGQMSQFEILKLFKYKEAKESRIRSLADENRNILPPHVFLAIKNYRLF